MYVSSMKKANFDLFARYIPMRDWGRHLPPRPPIILEFLFKSVQIVVF